jgi:hypothetical protein
MVVGKKEMGQEHCEYRIEKEAKATGHRIYKHQLRVLKTSESKTCNLYVVTN